MRSIWSGSISFGLVNVPVTLHPATKSRQLSFQFLNKKDKHPVKYLKVDPVEDIALSKEDIVKGYEFEKGQYVVLEDKDFEAAEVQTGRTMDISDFIKLEQVDPIYYQKSYYLAPTEASRKAYKVLVASLEKENKAAIAKMVIRNKQHLVIIRPRVGVLLMETMFYNDEIRLPEQINQVLEGIETSEGELKMAGDLIKAMTADFKPEKYKDRYRKNLLNIIEKKIEGKEVVVPALPRPAEVVDIMGALKQSIAHIEEEKKAAEQKKTA